MPPSDAEKQLSQQEIELICRWIEQGAPWQEHWSLVPARSVANCPPVKDAAWPRNPIDRFVLARLEAEGLEPEAEAAKEQLVRRVAFDLTGLPPTLDQIGSFLADNAPDAYEKLVDRLPELAPLRRAHGPLLARRCPVRRHARGCISTTSGLCGPIETGSSRHSTRTCLSTNFTIEQLAGDLLPEPTRDQLIATGFNRCNVTTSEGGSINEEYLVRYAVDRTETAIDGVDGPDPGLRGLPRPQVRPLFPRRTSISSTRSSTALPIEPWMAMPCCRRPLSRCPRLSKSKRSRRWRKSEPRSA